jgi:hypothetical protein
MMNWTIEKPKPPKGQSYALKTSLLQEMIRSAGVETAVHLIYRYSNKLLSEITLLDCHYWLPNANVPYSRFYITTSCVDFEDRKIADDLMQLRILPELINWMQKIVAQSDSSTLIRHDMLFKAGYKNREVRITHS